MSDVSELVKKLTSGQWTTMEVFEAADALTVQQQEIERLREALIEISSPTQSTRLLWWQIRARAALTGKEGGDDVARPAVRTPNVLTKVFGFPNDYGYASRKEMETDYRRAARLAHPDSKYGTAELLAALGDLYEIEKMKF